MRCAALVLALASCGAPPSSASPTIVAIGDSLVEDVLNDPDWAETLCGTLSGTTCSDTGTHTYLGGNGKVYAGGTVTIRQIGDTGDALRDEIFGRYCARCISPTAPGSPYGAVIFDGGINDAILGYTAAETWAKWQLMLDDAYTRGLVVVVLYDAPWATYASYTAGRETMLEDLWTSMLAWCSGKSRAACIDLGGALDTSPADGTCDAGKCADGLHWSASGSAAVAALVASQAGGLLLGATP